jgi:hypothetical protein
MNQARRAHSACITGHFISCSEAQAYGTLGGRDGGNGSRMKLLSSGGGFGEARDVRGGGLSARYVLRRICGPPA